MMLRRPASARRVCRLLSSPRHLATVADGAAVQAFDLASIQGELAREHARAGGGAQAAGAHYASAAAPWHWLDREMSSNVAGETGAVCIYEGAACALQWRGDAAPSTLQFVEMHRLAEQAHLDLFEALLPEHKHTRLLPMWRLAGFALGFAPTLVSDRLLFLTIEAVETFVEVHYQEQIVPLRAHGRCPQLVSLLEHCCADEVHHKDDAAARAASGEGVRTALGERAWQAVVRTGSAVAAEVARRV